VHVLPDLIPRPASVAVNISGNGTVVGTLHAGARTTQGVERKARPIVCGLESFACYALFDAKVASDETITLTPRPARGYVFKEWGGACAGAGKTCTVSLDAVKSVFAVFVPRNATRAVAVTMGVPQFQVGWRQSVGKGKLVVSGSIAKSARVRIQMRLRPTAGPLLTRRLQLPSGRFDQRPLVRAGLLPRGALVLPGVYVITLTGRAGGAPLPLQIRTATLAPPPEGVVRKGFASRSANGRPVSRLPVRSKVAWANFRFEAQPRRGRILSVSWYYPNGRLLGTVLKPNRPVVSSFIRSDAGIAGGLWVAELRAGGRIVKRLAVRIAAR
jgi:hypothetical protein